MDVVALAALMTSNSNAHIGGYSIWTTFPNGQIGDALLVATVDAAKAEIVATPVVRLGRSAMKLGWSRVPLNIED